MPEDASPPSSATDFDYAKAVAKEEARWTPPALRINKFLNRPLAALLVKALFRTRLTPNQVTWAGFLAGLAGAGFFLGGTRWSFAAGGILAQMSSIIDCADGMLARARRQESDYGAALDIILDRVGEFALLGAATAGQYARFGSVRQLGLGLLAMALYFLELTLFYLIKAYRKDGRMAETAENRAWLMALIAVFGVVDRVDLGIWFLLGGAAIAVLYQLGEFLFVRREHRI
jgi:phosphatidylglycerophosphate synthase